MIERPATNEAADRGANRALLIVSCAVLLASSTWFSGTAAVSVLRNLWSLNDAESAWLTISVQLGFITGTFLYAFLNLADRFNARRVFFASALLGALFNAGFAWLAGGLAAGVAFRFLTGLTLAGVYPVGMKIVAMWFRKGLGWRLGVMVGALTLGTATPYFIQAVGAEFDWRKLVTFASFSAVLGGALMLTGVSDGPYLKGRARFDPSMLFKVFQHRPFRYTAFGYFGHMWELYAFWSLATFYLGASFQANAPDWANRLSLLAFATIGIGAIGCVAGGWVSRWVGSVEVALASLIISGSLCALSGFAFRLPPLALMPFIFIWGIFVISDSPQFSALAARHCPPEYTGTALTVQNGIGFAITIISIQLLPLIAKLVGWQWAFTFLTAGPLAGAYFMSRLREEAFRKDEG
ncbi:MAG: MFS transporter [Blastocatellia bacterium]|nr:MFS transporter [Blastocatellia bacterium]